MQTFHRLTNGIWDGGCLRATAVRAAHVLARLVQNGMHYERHMVQLPLQTNGRCIYPHCALLTANTEPSSVHELNTTLEQKSTLFAWL